MSWRNDHRPGYFGRRKTEIITKLNADLGEGNWRLGWVIGADSYEESAKNEIGCLDFVQACKEYYEESYYRFFLNRPWEIDFVCKYIECYDNAMTNIESGLDYSKQESYSTHIQDIAVRNVLKRLGREFMGINGKHLQIRSPDSDGFRFNPGNVPFFAPELITHPSLAPTWAKQGSVEDFWQSNKWIQVKS
jgi:hypothetical protein